MKMSKKVAFGVLITGFVFGYMFRGSFSI